MTSISITTERILRNTYPGGGCDQGRRYGDDGERNGHSLKKDTRAVQIIIRTPKDARRLDEMSRSHWRASIMGSEDLKALSVEDWVGKILFVQPLRMLMAAEREPCQDQWEAGGQHVVQFLWTSLCIDAILQHPIYYFP